MRMAAALALIAISLLTTTCDKAPGGGQVPTGKVPQAAQQAAPIIPGKGTLRVWVPAGAIGHRFWIYLNGRIAASPSASDTTDASPYFMVVHLEPGWSISNSDFQTRVIHEQWDSGNLSEDNWLHLFQPIDLPVSPGDYTVELLIESRGRSPTNPDFPFAITHRRTVVVPSGKTVAFVASIPDNWEAGPDFLVATPVGPRCRLGAGVPDLDALMVKVKAYQADPVANALRGATDIGKGLVFLKLPPSLGGAREFGGPQLKRMVRALSAASHFPNGQDVTDCEEAYPDFSSSYREYGSVLQVVQGEIDGFERDADRLVVESPS